MFVRVYVYVYICMCVCVCVLMYSCMLSYIYIYLYIYIYIHTQVPIFELHDDSTHLNAYCLDFFKHGQIDALEIYNKMNGDDLWEDLRSFLLVLKALTAAMQRRHSSMNEGRQTLFDDQNVLDSSNHLTIQRANATGCCLNGFQEHRSESKTRYTPYCLRPSIYVSICESIHYI